MPKDRERREAFKVVAGPSPHGLTAQLNLYAQEDCVRTRWFLFEAVETSVVVTVVY